jgi:hypothetical protein
MSVQQDAAPTNAKVSPTPSSDGSIPFPGVILVRRSDRSAFDEGAEGREKSPPCGLQTGNRGPWRRAPDDLADTEDRSGDA